MCMSLLVPNNSTWRALIFLHNSPCVCDFAISSCRRLQAIETVCTASIPQTTHGLCWLTMARPPPHVIVWASLPPLTGSSTSSGARMRTAVMRVLVLSKTRPLVKKNLNSIELDNALKQGLSRLRLPSADCRKYALGQIWPSKKKPKQEEVFFAYFYASFNLLAIMQELLLVFSQRFGWLKRKCAIICVSYIVGSIRWFAVMYCMIGAHINCGWGMLILEQYIVDILPTLKRLRVWYFA